MRRGVGGRVGAFESCSGGRRLLSRARSLVDARTLLLLAVLAAGPLLAIAPTATAKDGAVSRASGDLGVPGVSEQRLRAWETAVLGPQHAAEHAALRAERRDPGTTAPAGGFRLTAKAVAVDPSVGGQWVTRFDIPVMGINAAMLPTGKVLWYAYPNEPDSAPRRDEALGGALGPEPRATERTPSSGSTRRSTPTPGSRRTSGAPAPRSSRTAACS